MPFGSPASATNFSCTLVMYSRVGGPGRAAVKQGTSRDVPCFTAALPGPPTLLYMTSVQLKFVAEAGDPKGTWTAQVVVRDLLRNVSLPLQARFDVR